ncbi:hypothetical protein ACQ4PT_051233 [Festuca glaucescens]
MKQPRSSGSANQFEAMSDRADDEGNTEMAVAGGEDPIVALPDDVRRYLMSFLPSRDAVRTCVLAKSWRTFWKSVPALRISDPESFEGAHGLSTFVDELIRLRDPVPLNVCDISSVVDYDPDPSCDFDRSDGEFRRMEPWLQHAVSNRVQVLRVRFICWIVFRNYLKCYPFFGKLKTLLLNEWCTVDNFTVLVYFLQHSPILEALTLQLHFETREEQLVTETDESYNSSVPSIISKHLKVVKIICDTKEDARVHHILKIFRTHGVPTEQIDIQ